VPDNQSSLDRFSDFIVQFVPDAITASVIMLGALVIGALALGSTPVQIVDAYYKGFWSLVTFTGQMTLIVVLGSAVASSPFFQSMVGRLSELPKSTNQFVALAVALAGAASYCFWGLGYALSPIIAIYFARTAERKQIHLHFPFFMATVFAAVSIWQFGLSASAPLIVATPGHFLEKLVGVIPPSRTVFSPAALLDVSLFTIAVIVTGCWLMPKTSHPISQYPGVLEMTATKEEESSRPKTYSEKAEAMPYFGMIMVGIFLIWLWYHFIEKGNGLNINSLNIVLLLLTFLLYKNVKAVTKALEKAVVAGWPVIILYHLYAGLSGVIESTPVGEAMANLVAASSNAMTFPTLSAAIGTVFSFFIPSSGGQWAIQGLVTAKSAMAVGVSVERGLLAMSVGDHMGNLTSPFWYVVISGIARLDFRTFFGYGLIYAVIWFVIGAVVFTFAPC
jgi:short-chain fatty acids transporter